VKHNLAIIYHLGLFDPDLDEVIDDFD